MAMVVHYHGNRDRAEKTVQAITEAGGRAVAVGGDLADETAAARLFDVAEQEFGGIDVLVRTKPPAWTDGGR